MRVGERPARDRMDRVAEEPRAELRHVKQSTTDEHR